jgi:MOSC domain-containing protein YiiM
VSLSARHSVRKSNQMEIRLEAGVGVLGDAHAGKTVQHRYARRRTPNAPNLRQVHLIPCELLETLQVQPGEMGENITTQGIDLSGLPEGACLHLGASAVVRVTGLRDPCVLLNRIRPGLMQATIARGADGRLIRRAGIMSVVLVSGDVRAGDPIRVELPPGPPRALEPV